MSTLPNLLPPSTPGALAGKVAIVTGAGSGIGRAAALAFARQGATVVLAGRRAQPLQGVAQQIEQAGGRHLVCATDVRRDQDVAELVSTTVQRFGRLDIAFNNAGIPSFGLIGELAVAEFDDVIATNVRGVWLLQKHEISAMRTVGNGGVIINTSSIAATGGTAGLSAYAASKAALDAMVRVLALEVGADGIRVNNISPGVIRTEMSTAIAPEFLSAIQAHTALKRIGEPEDVADVAVWLASDAARYITGQSILVDGGFNIAGVR
ncbi:MAG: SDR family NAD(P)-dependent oxidoreductase [Rhodanobacter sp.]